MSRCLTSFALLFAATLLMGCAEESLDLPIVVPEDSIPATTLEDGAPSLEAEIEEPEEPSAVNSIWNALLKGTAEAIDDSEPQP